MHLTLQRIEYRGGQVMVVLLVVQTILQMLEPVENHLRVVDNIQSNSPICMDVNSILLLLLEIDADVGFGLIIDSKGGLPTCQHRAICHPS